MVRRLSRPVGRADRLGNARPTSWGALRRALLFIRLPHKQTIRVGHCPAGAGTHSNDVHRKMTVVPWVVGALLASLCVATAAFAVRGLTTRGADDALDATARVSFAFFWLAYCGGALVTLFGDPFRPVKDRARQLGLAFASAQLVHLGIVGWLCWVGAAPTLETFLIFGVAAVFAYTLAVLSFVRLSRWYDGWLRRAIWSVGLNYIAFAYAIDFLHAPFRGSVRHVVAYAPFAGLAILGPCLRLSATAQRRLRRLRAASG